MRVIHSYRLSFDIIDIDISLHSSPCLFASGLSFPLLYSLHNCMSQPNSRSRTLRVQVVLRSGCFATQNYNYPFIILFYVDHLLKPELKEEFEQNCTSVCLMTCNDGEIVKTECNKVSLVQMARDSRIERKENFDHQYSHLDKLL